jgi:hypothetical protein
MPSTSPEPARRLLAGAAALTLVLALAGPVAAADKSGQLCEANGTVTGEGQLRDRTKKCKKDDVLVVSLTPASIAAARVAALVCDFADQVLIEDTTEAPGVARVTCTYVGDTRSKR